MTYEKIIVEQRGDIGIIRMNDPASLNAVSIQSFDELSAAFDDLAGSSRAIVLTGEGRAFCSGANLGGNTSLEEDFGLILETHINPLMTKLRNLPVPWISAVRGPAAGVGCSLALAADLIIAAESAYFLQAFVRIGLVPDGGSSHLLMRTIGRVRAMEVMMLGEKIPAALALKWGMINRLVSEDALEPTALELAERLAKGPTKTLGLIRKVAWAAVDADWADALLTERREQNNAGRTRDAGDAILAFRDKRPAVFSGA
ncbi:MAG: enoyl-CoA hydratase-related protein [Sphingobium sp.]